MRNIQFYLFIGISFVLGLKVEGQGHTEKVDWNNSSFYYYDNAADTGKAIQYENIAIDEAGNTYICGEYIDTVIWGSFTITTKGLWDFFLAKINKHGVVEWVKTANGPEDPVSAYCMVSVDKKGHVFVTGEFTYGFVNTMDFGNNVTLYDNSYADLFLVCYDTSGNAKWAKTSPGLDPSLINTDSVGSCIVANDADINVFNPSGKNVFSSYYYYQDTFSYSVRITNTIWDKNHNLYVAGYFYSGMTIGGINYYTHLKAEQQATFLIKYDSNYNEKWVKVFKSTNGNVFPSNIATDNVGNVIITGGFTSNFDYQYSDSSILMIDSIKLVNNDSLNSYGFLASFDSKGIVQWARRISRSATINNLNIDSTNNIYISGTFQDTARFNQILLSCNGNINGFAAKYNKEGDITWANDIGNNKIAAIFLINNNIIFFLEGQFLGEFDKDLSAIWIIDKIHGLAPVYALTANSTDDVALLAGGYGGAAELSPFLCNVPSSVLSSKGNLNYCKGNSINVTLKTNTDVGSTITWVAGDSMLSNNNDTALHISAAGKYYFLSTDSTGCQAISNSITINVFPKINVDLFSTKPTCNVILHTDTGKGYIYQWFKNDTAIINANSYMYKAIDSAKYKIMVTNGYGYGCNAITKDTLITLLNLISPAITQSGDTLTSSAKTGNQWLLNDTLIQNAINQKYVAVKNGNYSVVVTDTAGCSAASKPVNYILSGINQVTDNVLINIHPNPFTSQTTIEATVNENTPVSLAIYDMTGRQIVAQAGAFTGGQFVYTFDAAQYGCGSGVYFVKMVAEDAVVVRKIIRN